MTTCPAEPNAELIVMCACSPHVHIVMLIIAAALFGVAADLIAVSVSLALTGSTFDPV